MLAVMLPGVAGAVNASGAIALGVYTSHVTGSAARIGDEFALNHSDKAGEAAALIGLFLLGAMSASALVEIASRQHRPRYVVALLLEATLIALFALLSIHSERHWRFQRAELLGMLCFAMGMQNAMVTRVSGAVVRTTHLTGIVTDLGIESVHWVYWRIDKARGIPPQTSPDLKRARLHLTIFGSFVSGATVGPVLYLWVGSSAMLLPVAVLLLLAAFDSLMGLTGRIHFLDPKPLPSAPPPSPVRTAEPERLTPMP